MLGSVQEVYIHIIHLIITKKLEGRCKGNLIWSLRNGLYLLIVLFHFLQVKDWIASQY